MEIDIEQLRRDFDLTAEINGWTEEDKRAVGGVIAEAIKRGDEPELLTWAREMALERELRASFGPRLRELETSVRAARAERQERVDA